MTQIRPAEETQSWCEGQDGRQPLGENKTGRSGAGIGAGAGRGGRIFASSDIKSN